MMCVNSLNQQSLMGMGLVSMHYKGRVADTQDSKISH